MRWLSSQLPTRGEKRDSRTYHTPLYSPRTPVYSPRTPCTPLVLPSYFPTPLYFLLLPNTPLYTLRTSPTPSYSPVLHNTSFVLPLLPSYSPVLSNTSFVFSRTPQYFLVLLSYSPVLPSYFKKILKYGSLAFSPLVGYHSSWHL